MEFDSEWCHPFREWPGATLGAAPMTWREILWIPKGCQQLILWGHSRLHRWRVVVGRVVPGSLTSIYIEDVHHFGSWMALEWLNIPLPERIPSELRFRAERVKPRGAESWRSGIPPEEGSEGTERTKVPIKDFLLEVIIGFAFLTEKLLASPQQSLQVWQISYICNLVPKKLKQHLKNLWVAFFEPEHFEKRWSLLLTHLRHFKRWRAARAPGSCGAMSKFSFSEGIGGGIMESHGTPWWSMVDLIASYHQQNGDVE